MEENYIKNEKGDGLFFNKLYLSAEITIILAFLLRKFNSTVNQSSCLSPKNSVLYVERRKTKED
jgi:hypothetical protein